MSRHDHIRRPAHVADTDCRPTLVARAGRVSALLLVLLTFLRAGTAAPCDAHRHGGAHPHHGSQAAQSADVHGHGDHAPVSGHDDAEGECHCLGACHPAAPAALPSASCSLALAAIALLPTAGTVDGGPAIARANQAYILPYSTAPPLRAA